MNISLLIVIIALIAGCIFYDELYNKNVENMSNGLSIALGFIVSFILVEGLYIILNNDLYKMFNL